MRAVITRVLPVPAPASTSSGPSVVETASRCAGFSDWSRSPMLVMVAFGVGGGSSVGRFKGASYTTVRNDESVVAAALATTCPATGQTSWTLTGTKLDKRPGVCN